jgi:hypothetical protein
LIGIGDLWGSLVYTAPNRKSITPLWFNKVFWALMVLLILGAAPSFYIYSCVKDGFSSPEFSIRPCADKLDKVENPTHLPFGYQVNLPSPPEDCWLYPKEGYVNVKVKSGMGCALWTLESKNSYDDMMDKLPKTKEQILGERYGIIPRIIKEGFGEKPDYFFEIKQNGLWGAVSVKKLGKTDEAVVRVYLWDDAGMPLGAISGFSASTDPKDWKWVYSIRKTESPLWTPDNFEETARACMDDGQIGLAEFYLASAVIADSDKSTRLKTQIEYLQKHGLKEKAKYQLKVALKDYPQDSILKSIKLPGGAGK